MPIKLEKAIEILNIINLEKAETEMVDFADFYAAIQLGNEALKRVRLLRATRMRSDLWDYLPGEDAPPITLFPQTPFTRTP